MSEVEIRDVLKDQGCGWGEPSDAEGGEGDPHQHSLLGLKTNKLYSRQNKHTKNRYVLISKL